MIAVRQALRMIRFINGNRRLVWNILRVPIGLGVLIGLTLPLPTHSDTIDCPLQARLSVGSLARVAYTLAITPSESRVMKDYPSDEAQETSSLPPGDAVSVLQGPTCAKGVRWWQVQPLSGVGHEPIGWMPETDAANTYTLEPWQVAIDYAQSVENGAAVVRVNAQGIARWLIAYPVTPIAANGLTIFPGAEDGPLINNYAAQITACPKDAKWQDPTPDQQMTVYRSPDSTRLLAIRHIWRAVQNCDGTISPRYGLDRLSLIAPDGERLLFDIPLHANLGGLSTSTDAPIPDAQVNQIMTVQWSPDNIHALAWVHYRSASEAGLTHLYVIDVVRGTLTDLDSGFSPTWNTDGSLVNWFRTDGSTTTMIQATPQNANRQTLSLPDTVQALNARLAPIWNADGTRFVACVRADQCASVAVVDVQTHRVLAPQDVPSHSSTGRWVLGDRALLWLPSASSDHPNRLLMQRIPDGSDQLNIAILQSFDAPIGAGDQITDASSFPDGQHVLIVVRGSDSALHYFVLNLADGSFQRVQFTL